jgi:VWFA-related protein
MRCAALLFSVAVTLRAAMPASAQNQPGLPVFKSRADLVLVPVIVRNKHDEHVPGLKAADFVLEQDGRAQTIASLEEVTASTSPMRPSIQSSGSFTNQHNAPQEPRQLVIFAIDLVNTPVLDVGTAKKAVLKFLDTQLQPNQMVGLVTIERTQVRLLHAFTTEQSVLSAALGKVTGTPSATQLPENLAVSLEAQHLAEFILARDQLAESIREMNLARQQYDIRTALDSLRAIAYWVAGIPGRKVLIWVTGDIPWATEKTPDSKPSKFGAYLEDYVLTMQTLASYNVAVYPVDVRGLLTDVDFGSVFIGPGSDVFNESLRGGIAESSAALRAGVQHLANTHVAMDNFANATGGRAFYNRNDIPRLFRLAAEDSSRYYMLSYYMDRQQVQPGWHKLNVTVSRKGLTARARNGFFVSSPSESETSGAADEKTALSSPFEYTALPLTLRWTNNNAVSDKHRIAFELCILPEAQLADQGSKGLVNLDFLLIATDSSGIVVAHSTKNYRATLTPDVAREVSTNGLTYSSQFEVKTGGYAVRFVVRDNVTGRMGSVTAPLRVE